MPVPKLDRVSTSFLDYVAGKQTDSAPQHHHQREDLLEAVALDEQLDRELGGQKAHELNRSPLTDN